LKKKKAEKLNETNNTSKDNSKNNISVEVDEKEKTPILVTTESLIKEIEERKKNACEYGRERLKP